LYLLFCCCSIFYYYVVASLQTLHSTCMLCSSIVASKLHLLFFYHNISCSFIMFLFVWFLVFPLWHMFMFLSFIFFGVCVLHVYCMLEEIAIICDNLF
jgi:hypothetical protein